jgi:hypothetical protein
MVARACLAVCALIIAILPGNGAWQLRGARIVVQNTGSLSAIPVNVQLIPVTLAP